MLSISQFSERAFDKEEYHVYFLIAFVSIIALNIFSMMYYLFNLFITFRVKYYKTNIQKIHQAIYMTCPVSSTILIVEKILDIIGKRKEFEETNTIFIFKPFFRTAIMGPPLFSLTAIMLDRLFATIFIKDYEKKHKSFLGYFIILLLGFLSSITSYVLSYTDFVYIFVASHIILSANCYIISIILYRINRNYYERNRVRKNEYSLAERYQIAENIRMYQFFTHFISVLAAFPVTCIVCVLISHYDSKPFHREILCVIFDLSFTSLCILAPYLILKMSESWQNELDSILIKIGYRKQTKVEDICDRVKTLKNTFGEVMEFETSQHSSMYFDQLQKSWNS